MNIKKLVLLLLAAAMLSFVLPSCSKDNKKSAVDGLSLTGETVWRGERIYIDGITLNGITRTDNFLYRDGRVYFKTTEYPDGMEDPSGNRVAVTIHSVNTDGSDLMSIPVVDGKTEYFDCFTLDGDGNIVFMETVITDDSAPPEKTAFLLKKFSTDGSELSSVDITDAVKSTADEYFYDRSIAVDGSGNIYIASSTYILAFSPEGKLVFGTETEQFGYVNLLVVSATGDVYGRIYQDGLVIKKIDPVTGELGKDIKLSDTEYDYTSVPYSGAGKTEIYVDNGTSLTSLDPVSGEITEILNWVDSDLIRNEISGIFPSEDGSGFVCIGLSYPGEAPVITLITPHDASELPKRTELIMAGSSYAVTAPLEFQAVKFNTENDSYRIKIKKYTDDDYLTRLNSDIISGNIPDILIVDSQMNLQSYISKGLFCDMYEFIDSDSELSRDDLLPNVLSAFETDGKLYDFTSSFMISTVIGKASIFKESGIDFDRLEEIKNGSPQGTEIFSGMSKNDVLQYGLRISADNFIDHKKGECYFDSDKFIKLLEFANSFPSSAELNFDDGFWQHLDSMYLDESVLLMMPMISCYGDYFCYERGYFGDTVTTVGFPSVSGEPGSAIFTNDGFAISAKSGNSDGAWQFIRTLLLPEFQNETGDFPVRKSALDNKAKKEMNIGDDGSYSSIITMGDWSLASTKFVSDIGKPSQSDIDRINTLVTSVSRRELYNSTIREIAAEEASAYFAGSKSAKETADMIQNRVKLYLTENS
ncbi:MAG: extracellular solute-binding protein [Oscillospiraceae bacterium]|nr:extracellular solute-binding protein [Oscillospiraceae bacterium]